MLAEDLIEVGHVHRLTQRIQVCLLVGELQLLEFVPYASFSKKKYEDVRRRVPDCSKAEKLLGWRSLVDLATGLARTLEFNYQMGLGHERCHADLPGEIGNDNAELSHRSFYRRWAQELSVAAASVPDTGNGRRG